jgi:hypothetical protein
MRTIDGANINKVSIIDDEPSNRDVYKLPIEDSEMEAVAETGPFWTLDACVSQIKTTAQAALSDYKLGVKKFATFNGAELAASLYGIKIPTILCTRYEAIEMLDIRPFRARIPVLMRPDELHADTLVEALSRCINEFADKFLETRRAWRALVRIEEVHVEPGQGTTVDVCVPSWTRGIVLRLRLEEFPPALRPKLKEGGRHYAYVNTGAERIEEIYFRDWEVS